MPRSGGGGWKLESAFDHEVRARTGLVRDHDRGERRARLQARSPLPHRHDVIVTRWSAGNAVGRITLPLHLDPRELLEGIVRAENDDLIHEVETTRYGPLDRSAHRV